MTRGIDPQPRFERLDALLDAHAPLWRAQPFRLETPEWCVRHPTLAAHLLALDDAAVHALAADNAALVELAAGFVPALGELAELLELPSLRGAPPLTGAHFAWEIPGRKAAQIEAFAAALGPRSAPVIEWCAGKGHLGRLLASAGAAVLSIERDAALCAAGNRLARRARQTEQRFVCADVLAPSCGCLLAGAHAVALHACGELHRTLVRGAIAHGARALDVAPCCYDRVGEEFPARLADGPARLRPSRADLRLAVTDSGTAAPRELALRDREMAWKLGFQMLRAPHADQLPPLRPVPRPWARLDLETYCRRLAARERVELPARVDWAALAARAQARRARVMRLGLLRLAFRRAIELWTVLDAALALRAAGYAVTLGQWCGAELTPRNLLLGARR